MDGTARPDWSGRLDHVRTRMATGQLDALVVSARPNLTYLTGFDGSAGLLLVTGETSYLLLDGRYQAVATEAVEAGGLAPVVVEPVDRRYDHTLGSLVTRLGVKRCGFEAGHVTVATLREWRALGPADWLETDDLVEGLRLVKDDWEVARLRAAARLLSDVARQLAAWVRPGLTERSIARSIDLAMDRAGFLRPAFPTIVASGPNSAHPHAVPGERRLGRGDLVVLDFGGVLEGYCVDLTRMAAIGQVPAPARELFEAVRAAQTAAIGAVRSGVRGSVVDGAARQELERRGLGEAFVHATGHGLGLEVHEAPRLARDEATTTELQAGVVCTIEPGAYVTGLGGVRLEDDVLVTADGCEVLTDAPRDLLVL